ncbi:hypothetical protein ART_2372 [Arthrobacter sp. PAMC 25486]|uniref:helix-turn-helix domain-containing protein n=1 Tax=Arthrobacter sp. PAMC 25486 TaxID=1494608 RepID=UPI000535C94E|nr:helix-turn-helix domain-containing protein [Arthrobacter sp. PAMC 25486]AIY01971.1 hypothetical protein ART_2372 [Arthrobacter sp. PAMC 25486]
MKELAGRLSALDPEASETLKVITYFDKLVDGRVGHEGMLRGAAVLCGSPIGYRRAGQDNGRRFAADGTEMAAGPSGVWPNTTADEGAIVWLERAGSLHANDPMVLERLAIALSITTMRLDTLAPARRAIEVLLSGDASPEECEEAAARLSLGTHEPTYAIAIPAAVPIAQSLAHTLVGTRLGVVRAVLASGDTTSASRAGIGIAAQTPIAIRESWRSALIALRLTDTEQPVLRASDLGALLVLADATDQNTIRHPDVSAIESLLGIQWTVPLLRGLAGGASRRSLATQAGVHHSTMGVRLDKLPETLGYDPSTPSGRTRLDVALMLHRLTNAKFDDGS